jgi:hypothetical protein
LSYQLELGGMEQNIIKRLLPHEKLPERIANAPQLELHLLFYWNAFLDLDTERDFGWGLPQIPWTAIYTYAEAYGMNDAEFDRLLMFIRAMDKVKIEFIAAKREKK